jgi:hypothetical protein
MQREGASEREKWRVGGFDSQGMWHVDSFRSSSILDEGSMDRRKSAFYPAHPSREMIDNNDDPTSRVSSRIDEDDKACGRH